MNEKSSADPHLCRCRRLSGEGRGLPGRVAARLPVIVVAQGFIRVPDDPLIERVAAGQAPDAADDWIMQRADGNSIVVTSDIPLAARAVKAGAVAIAPDGRVFTEEAIGMALAMRDLMTDLRSAGGVTSGPRPFSPARPLGVSVRARHGDPAAAAREDCLKADMPQATIWSEWIGK